MHRALIRNRDHLSGTGRAREPREERHVVPSENGRLLASAQRQHGAETSGALSFPESADFFVPAREQCAAALAIFETTPAGQHQRQENPRSLQRFGISDVLTRAPITALDHILVAAFGKSFRISDLASVTRRQYDLQIVLLFSERQRPIVPLRTG